MATEVMNRVFRSILKVTDEVKVKRWSETLHFVSDETQIDSLISRVANKDVRDYILCPDWAGRNALHTTPTVLTAAAIIFRFPDRDLDTLIWSRDVLAQSPLHYARTAEIAKLLIGYMPLEKYIMHPNWFMRTALHEVRKLEVALVLVEKLPRSKRVEFIMWTDWNGETAIDLAIKRGKVDVAHYLMEYLDEEAREKYNNNLKHPDTDITEYEDTYEGTENEKEQCLLLPDLDVISAMKSGGLSGNNPLLYVVACQQTDKVVELLKQFGTEKVNAMVTHRNAYGLSCLELAQLPLSRLHSCFPQSVDKNIWSGFMSFFKSLKDCHTVNQDMVKVLRHMSNLHILTEPGSIIDYSMATKALKKRRLEVQPASSTRNHPMLIEATVDLQNFIAMSTDLGSFVIFLIDIQVSSQSDLSQDHSIIDKVNQKNLHGIPKVVYIQYRLMQNDAYSPFNKRLKLRNLSNPTLPPDFILWMAMTERDLRDEVREKLLEPCNLIQLKITDIWMYMSQLPATICTSAISMTIGKRFAIHPDPQCELGSPSVGTQRKKLAALIFWSSRQRSGAEEELRDVRYILTVQLKAEVTERCDISAEEMIKDLKTFSHDTKDAELAILIIMSHGDANGDIVCHENSVCKVHHILEAFSEEKENSRLIFLQCCRGSFTGVATPETAERSVMRSIDQLVISSSSFPGSRISWNEQQHGRVVKIDNYQVSDDTMIVFSTLSGHRANRGLLFREIRHHLYHVVEAIGLIAVSEKKYMSLIHNYCQRINVPSDAVESVPAVCTDDCNVCINRNLIELITDIAGRVRDNSKLVQHLEVINTMKKPMYINIYKSSPPPDLDLLDEA